MGARTRVALKRISTTFGLLLALVLPLASRSKQAEPDATIVDTGTFTISVGGRAVGTETFTIKQLPDVNIATAEIKIDDGKIKSQQSSECRITSGGELRRYDWRELAPEKSEIIVEPQEGFLIEHVMPPDKAKKFDQPFLMPSSTVVLDDFFFSQRELLTWRYLASTCKPVNGQTQCSSQKTQFGVIIPHQYASGIVSMEYLGRDKVSLRGGQLELSHFRLTNEDSPAWELWTDDEHKLIRILIPAMNTEVLRD